MKTFPKKPLPKEEILSRLKEYARDDFEPKSGKLFTIAFEPGVEELREVIFEAWKMFADKNILDFTEFPSAIRLEKDVVDMAISLMRGDEEVVGTYTFGGTESVFLAVKAARDRFILKRGSITIPEIVMPVTGHPCYEKAAEYLGMKVKRVRVDTKTYQADPEAINEALTEDTAMIVGSAPNWPFGTVDPIKELADLARTKGIWFHVDACVGGFILPFMRRIGENLPDFDFTVEGVTSISLDPHKYAYSTIGASVILFRKKFYKMYSQYANLRWPGYPIVNPAVLSSRSEGPLAATWAVLHYLGEEGYTSLARKIVSARNSIVTGLRELGFDLMGEPTVIAAFTSPEVNLFRLCDEVMKRGWIFLPQKGIPEMQIPPSIHLTFTPIHEKFAGEMLRDLRECKERVAGLPASEAERFVEAFGLLASMLTPSQMDLASLGKMLEEAEKFLGAHGEKVLETIGFDKGLTKEWALIYQMFHSLPPDIMELLTNYVVIELFRRGT
ncbi:MAG: aspartate aminotransferase family protein [Candidatus Hadarchaeales archaeon]